VRKILGLGLHIQCSWFSPAKDPRDFVCAEKDFDFSLFTHTVLVLFLVFSFRIQMLKIKL